MSEEHVMKKPAPTADSNVLEPTPEQARRLAELANVDPELTSNARRPPGEPAQEVSVQEEAQETVKVQGIAEEPPKPTELQSLMGRCQWEKKTNSWTDRFGVPHGIFSLDFGDLGEFEKRHGEITKAFEDRDTQMNVMITLVWLGLRKEGCTEVDLDNENFKYTRPAVGRMFGLVDGDVLVSVAMNILRLSGLDVDVENLGNELEAAAEKAVATEPEKA